MQHYDIFTNFGTNIAIYWVLGVAAIVAYYFEAVRPSKASKEVDTNEK